MSNIEPGWYPDPADPSTQRYWAGSGWVGKPIPADVEPPAQPEPLEVEEAPSPAQSNPDVAPHPLPDRPGRPPQIIQRTPGAKQPPDTVPIRSLGITIGWVSNFDISRILAGRILAAPGARFIARLIDFLCLLGLNAVVNGYFIYNYLRDLGPVFEDAASGTSYSDLEVPDQGQLMVIYFIAIGLWFAYEVPSHLNTGQTVGKRMMNIRVESLSTSKLGWGRLTLRWSYSGLMIACFPFGVIVWIFDATLCLRDKPFRQCLHDKAPGTAVFQLGHEPNREDSNHEATLQKNGNH